MPVSADLLKALAEDPKSLEHQLGCMAGLFQIFDRQALGRRYGSKRVSNAGSGQSQPTSACETPRHDHHHHHRHNNNPYWMFEDDSSQRIPGDSFAVPKNVEPHHRPAYSDSSEIFTKSFETPTESRTSPDEKSNMDLSPMYSEESSVWDPSRDCTTSRYASFEHHHDERSELLHCNNKTLNVIVPSRVAPTSDIRDIVRASFERDHHQRPSFPSHKAEKPRHSVDAISHGQYLMKNLPRSASVDGKDRSSVAVADAPPAARHAPADLPRSSSVGGRGPSRMLSDWKDGLRSSAGSPRLTSKEREALLHKQKLDGRDGRDVTRLTVELKEGPRLSVSVDDRRASVDASPRPISRFRDELQPNFNRAADIKEFLLRGEKKAARDEHRFSVDGTRDAPRPCIAPRLSVDGRDNETGTLAARKLKLLDPKDPNHDVNFCRQSSGRKASNVVARLMGLDELVPKETTTTTPNKAATRFSNMETELYDQAFLQNLEFSPPPPPSPPDDYDYAHHASDHEAFHHGRQTQRFNESSSIHDHFAAKQQQELHSQTNTNTTNEGLAAQQPYNFKALAIIPSEDQVVKQQDEESVYLGNNNDEPKDAPQSARKAPQGRRSLWHIFEAMQLKGLLHGSSRRKQAEALRLHNLKEKECLQVKECQEVKDCQRRSQSLPPRLSTSAVAKEHHSEVEFHDRAPDVFPRALLEVHKSSSLEHAQADGSEEAFVVVKPVITRSMSCKAPAASFAPSTKPCTQPCGVVLADTDSARKYHPADETTPKNLSRAMSKSVGAYHRAAVNEQEPLLQQAPESSSQSTNGRQSRKERERGVAAAAAAAAARPTKSMSELPQRELQQRDSSPRSSRGVTATNNSQESRPTRSCSPSSVSPRCPGSVDSGTTRVTEASKVRRKAVAVKDREESKASLAHLRANATKQEFLKERASGDPDTPRLLRRSSSEGKLLSKIAEKTATADSASSAKVRSGNSPSMSLLRSKRPVAKDTSKSPMKTRPMSALGGLKSVAKTKERTVGCENVQASNVNRPAQPDSDCVPLAAQAQQPTESKAGGLQASSRCEVRATPGGALDQSGDTTHANARDHSVRTDPKAREKSIEIDEGVKTPRGVSIKKIDFSEDAQADVAEQPSPVSVLDNSHFDEELTPSPKAGKTSVDSLQDQSQRSEKDRRWSSARFLDLDLEETSPSLKPPESSQDTLDPPSLPLPQQTPHRHIKHRRVCLKDADEESLYVEELLHACNFPTELQSSNYVIDPMTFDHLESQRGDSSELDILDRRILFDCVNEVLERLLGTQLRPDLRPGLRWNLLRNRRVGVKEVLAELVDIPCAAAEDVCDTVYVILQKDLVKGRGQQWSDYHTELQEVGIAVERMIVKDLVEETVRELSAWSSASSSRRQLFV